MSGHDLSAGGDVLDRVTAVARGALTRYGASPGADVRLLNVSENATFLVTDPDAGSSVLRVHRLGYHSRAAIESELAWMDALRAQAGIRTPRVLPASDGSRVVEAAGRHCVRMEFLPGTEPAGAGGGPQALAHFAELGALTARMHAHARSWRRPAWFTRFRWDDDDAFGAAPPAGGRWGRWRDGVGVGPAEAEVLARLERALRERLGAFGTGPDRFGLIHADTRLANLLVHEGNTAVIDFDDSGFGWYLYDLGTTVSFFEDDPAVPGLVAAWLDGYRAAGGVLTADDLAQAWTFIVFRRLLLTAWIGSHPAAAGAAELGADYTRGSCDLAERYLSGQLDAGGLLPGTRGRPPGKHSLAERYLSGQRTGKGVASVFTSLAGRAVVVTGGTRGIGKGIASVFARNGAEVLITGRDNAAGRAAAAEIGAVFVPADVASKTDCELVAAVARRELGGIDVLCANAGIFPGARLSEMAEADIDVVLGTNLKGTILSVQACLPLLKASGRGRVILTSSITGPVTGFPGWAHYGASKAGQLGFMRTAAIELAGDGITVNAVLPGNIMTEGLAGMGEDYMAGMTAAIPMRKLGSVDDIGYAALFFATDEAAYITGQTIVVDGGQVLPESPQAVG